MVSLQTVVSAAQIERPGRSLAVSMQATLGAGADLSAAMDQLVSIADEVLPDSMGITFTREAATLDDTAAGMYVVLVSFCLC